MYSLEEHASRVCRLLEEVNTEEYDSQEIDNCEELEHNSIFSTVDRSFTKSAGT